MPARSIRYILITCALASGLFLQANAATKVTRGGKLGGPGTVTVRTGSGVMAVWNVQTGTLAKVFLQDDGDELVLMTGVDASTWFVSKNPGGTEPMSYSWKGYRLLGDTVVLLHEVKVAGGPTYSIQEVPATVTGPGGLLSLQRVFTVSNEVGEPGNVESIVKRIRTGTLGGLTLPVSTNGRLVPLGLDDNLQADVVFRSAEPTVITTIFNGHWVEEDRLKGSAKETTP